MMVTAPPAGRWRFGWIHAAVVALFLGLSLAGTPGAGLAQTPGLRGSAERLTNDLIRLHAQSRQASPSTPQPGQPSQVQPSPAQVMSDLLGVAQRRHKLLAELIATDPGAVLAMAISGALRAGLPPGVQAHVEEDVQIEGVLEVLHEDRQTGGRYLYFLEAQGTRFALHFAARPPEKALTGDRVRATGLRVAQAIALASAATGLQTLSAAPTPNTFGAQKTLVILVNFQDNPIQPYTRAYAQDVIFNTTSNFYRENSFQQTWLTGDVVGWYTVPYSSSPCNYVFIATDANTAAWQAGVDYTAYDRVVYAFPQNNACGWWGLGTVGGRPSRAWINGSLQLRVAGHELGHNFGLYHSHALECGTTTLAATCTRIEYGDTLDIMGGSSGDFNAFQKELLGWLNYGQSPPITTVTSSGTYTLDPYEPAGSNPKALKVELAPGEWYYVEYRQPIGFDGFIAGNTNVVNGVVLHYGSESSRDSSYLLDLTPLTASWSDPALDVGQSFTDPFSGLTITTVWANGSNAGVSVALGPGACVRANPTVTVSPTLKQSAAGTGVSYTASVTNNDSPGCATSTFAQTAAVPAGWTPTFTVPALTLAPGTTASTILQVTSPASAAGGAYPVAAITTNSVAPTYAGSASATYVVTTGSGGSFADTFDRGDSTVLGNGWVEVQGDLMIKSYQLWNAATLGFHRAVLPSLTGAKQTVAASFAPADNNGGPRFGLILRYQDAKNYYVAYRQVGGSSVLRIAKVVNGVETVLASASVPNPTLSVFSRLSAGANGTTLTLNLEGVRSISASDSTFAGGSVGILMGSTTTFATLAKSHRADNFSATVQ